MIDAENRWNPDARPSQDPPEESEILEEDSLPLPSGGAEQESRDTPRASDSRRKPGQNVELHAILGAGTALTGDLSFSGKVRIDGQLEGSATGGELLIVGEGAEVTGTLHARKVIILGGRVEANISATESIELYIPAVVRGDLKSPQIYMDRGIQFHGTCDMTLDPPPVELRPETTRGE